MLNWFMSQNVPSGPSTWNGGLTNISLSFQFLNIRFNNNTQQQLSFDVNPIIRTGAFITLASSIDEYSDLMSFTFDYSSSIIDDPILATGSSTRPGGSTQPSSSISINISVYDNLKLSINETIARLKNLTPFIRINNNNDYVKSFAVSYSGVSMYINGNSAMTCRPTSSTYGYYGIDRDSTSSLSYVGLWPTTLSYNLDPDTDYPIIISNSILKQYFKAGITNEIKIIYAVNQMFLYNS